MQAQWIAVTICVVMGVVMAASVAAVTPKTYDATATIALRWEGQQSGEAKVSNVRYLNREAHTVALLIGRQDVLNRTGAHLDEKLAGESVAGRVEAIVPLDSQLVLVAASAAHPAEAAALATTLAKEMVLVSAGGATSPDVDTLLAVEARPPIGATDPRLSLYLVAGAFIGLSVALLGVLNSLRRSTQTLSISEGLTAPVRGRALLPLHLVWTLLVAAVIPWRTDTYYVGGADPVVVAKAGLTVAALGLALSSTLWRGRLFPTAAAPLLFLGPYLVITVIGGMANHVVASSVVVAVRVVILAVTVYLLASSYPCTVLMRTLVHILGLLVIVAATTGLAMGSGRLAGTIPPVNPNLLALLAALVVIWLLAKVLTAQDTAWDLAALGGFLIIVVLTGSRTSAAALAAAGVAMMLRITALRVRSVVLFVLAVPTVTFLTLGTRLFASIFIRGDSENLSSLSNRTIAWSAAASLKRDFWQTWFGQGLSQKEISVPGQPWDTQILDSTWVSALVQGGYLGLAVVASLTLLTLLTAVVAPRATGPLWPGLVLFLTLGAFLESGLFDGTIAFMVFLVAALAIFGLRRRGDHHRPSLLDPASRPIAVATSTGRDSAIVAS